MRRRDFIIGVGAIAGAAVIAGIPPISADASIDEVFIHAGGFKKGDLLSVSRSGDSNGLYIVTAVCGSGATVQAVYPVACRDA